MVKYFIVYDDGTHILHIDRLVASVRRYGPQFQIIRVNPFYIDAEFREQYLHILNQPRGGGYWLWKPYIINKYLNTLNENDLLFYLDSKYYFTENLCNLYANYMETNDIMVWENKPNEETNQMKKYCKRDVVLKYGMENQVYGKGINEIWAGCVLLKKTAKTVQLMRSWLDKCCVGTDITDSPSTVPNTDDFIDHRHDQSLFSITLHQAGITPVHMPNRFMQNTRNLWKSMLAHR